MAKKQDDEIAKAKRLIRRHAIREAYKVAGAYNQRVQTSDGTDTPEVPKKVRRPLRYLFVTTASKNTPPLEGYLVPAAESEIEGVTRVATRYKVYCGEGEDSFTPAIKVRATGEYIGTFIGGAIRILKGYVPSAVVQQCTVAVESQKLWVVTLWGKAWGEQFGMTSPVIRTVRPEYVEVSDEPVGFSTSFGGERHALELETDLNLEAFHKKYLAMMLLWDFWRRHPAFSDDNKCDDLKALGVTSTTKSDRRSFTKDCSRAGCNLFLLPGWGSA